MDVSILRLPHSVARWNLVEGYLRLRKEAFVKRLKWPLELIEEKYEAEDYDAAPLAHYVVAHSDEKVLGGARLLQCDQDFADGELKVSYMIRDAVLGRIDMPSNIWADGEPPTDSETWELTRLVSSDSDPATSKAILSVCNAYIKKLGAKRCLFLTSPAVLRIAKRYGYAPVPKGPIVDNGDGKFLAFECPVI